MAKSAETAVDSPAPGAAVGDELRVIEAVWFDRNRGRKLPVRVVLPNGSENNLPVILFSHGLGGSTAGGKLWGEHWAANGYMVVHLQHAGSDEAVWKGKGGATAIDGMRDAASLSNLGLRVQDVRFAIDHLIAKKKAGEGEFARADVTRIGMAGHSFGAQTTLAVSGAANVAVGGQGGLDSRVTAAIAMSPNARIKRNLGRQFGDVRVPFMSITGTDDGAVLDDGTVYQDRLLPYKYMPPGGKYLLVLDGADHMIFNGQQPRARRKNIVRDREIETQVKLATLAFWDAHLRGSEKARQWLTRSLKPSLTTNDVFEWK